MGIGDDPLAVINKRRLEGFTESHGLGGDDVLQGASLGAGENGLVEAFAELSIAAEDQAAPRAPQGLMGGGGDHMTVGNGVWMDTGSHQTGDVGHVRQQIGPHLIGNGPEGGKVDGAGIGGIPANY